MDMPVVMHGQSGQRFYSYGRMDNDRFLYDDWSNRKEWNAERFELHESER